MQILRDLLHGRLPSEFLHQFPVAAGDLVDDLDHMHRHTNRACLVGDGTGNGLADPPCGIGGKLVSLGIVKLVHSTDQARVAFLDQIQNVQAAAGILLRNGDHQPEICLGKFILGILVSLCNPGGKFLLLLRSQQPDLADFLEVHPNGIVQIILGSQFYRIYQLFLFRRDLIGGIQLQFRTDNLNPQGFDCIVNMLDLLRVDVQLFQYPEHFGGLEHARFLSLAVEGQNGCFYIIAQLHSCVVRGCHIALPLGKKSLFLSRKIKISPNTAQYADL